jgi:hypothetical protein
MHATQPGGAHQPVGALVGTGHAGAAQLVMDPAHPDPTPMPGVDLTDPFGESGVVECPLGWGPVPPLVEALPGHAQHPAHESDRECLLRGLFRDKREPYWFWLAKKAAAEM